MLPKAKFLEQQHTREGRLYLVVKQIGSALDQQATFLSSKNKHNTVIILILIFFTWISVAISASLNCVFCEQRRNIHFNNSNFQG